MPDENTQPLKYHKKKESNKLLTHDLQAMSNELKVRRQARAFHVFGDVGRWREIPMEIVDKNS